MRPAPRKRSERVPGYAQLMIKKARMPFGFLLIFLASQAIFVESQQLKILSSDWAILNSTKQISTASEKSVLLQGIVYFVLVKTLNISRYYIWS